MRSAVELARQAKGHTFPNPAVGCVVVGGADGGEVLGVGWHPQAGYPHAEIYALADVAGALPTAERSTKPGELGAGDDALLARYLAEGGAMFDGVAKGATAYVTLEPCSHEGKRTPPCTKALLASGVRRVVLGSVDPNPRVDGGGKAFLADNGVEVSGPDLPNLRARPSPHHVRLAHP